MSFSTFLHAKMVFTAIYNFTKLSSADTGNI